MSESRRIKTFDLVGRIRDNPYGAGFFAISLIFLAFTAYVNYWSGLIPVVEFLSILVASAFFVYSTFFIAIRDRFGIISKIGMLSSLLLAVLAVFLLFSVSGKSIDIYILISAIYQSVSLIEYSIVFIFFFALISLGIFFLKKKQKLGYLFIVASFFLFLMPYYTVIASKSVVISDEAFIGFADSKVFVSGLNPYTDSVSGILLSNYTSGRVNSITYLMSNKVIGILNYPAGFLFANLPFYLLSNALHGSFILATKLEVGIFLLILLILISKYSSDGSYKKPLLGLPIIIALLLGSISTPFELLMLAFLIFAYAKIESKYAWLILGVCASLQELLWLPVILLIVYKASKEGLREGIRNLAGSILVFLALNSYLIAIGPMVFVRGVFNPIGNIIPDSGGVFGYLIAVVYGTSVSITGVLFIITALFAVAAFLYIGEKRMIPVLSLLPLLFLSHNLLYYPVFFIAFAFASFSVRKDNYEKSGFMLHKNLRKMLIGTMIALIFAGTTVILYSHSLYLRYFDMHTESVFVNVSNANSPGRYSVILKGNCTDACGNLSYLMFGFSGKGPSFFNVDNRSGVGYGVLEYNASDSGYSLNASLNLKETGRIYEMQMLVYNDRYAYFSRAFSGKAG